MRISQATSASESFPKGFPILLSERQHIVEPVFDYLRELATMRARPASMTTLHTYAHHLLDWFDTLEQSSIGWRDATPETLARYVRRHHNGPSPITGRPYQTVTINARIRTVCRFYRWAAERAWLKRTPFPSNSYRRFGRPQGFLAHTQMRRPAERNPFTSAGRQPQQRGLYAHEVRALLQVLDEPYRLMATWALCTGMRRMELCALRTAQIPDSMGLRTRDGGLVAIRLTTTKGGRPRNAHAPLGLVDQTNRYIADERDTAATTAARKTNGALFLTPHGGRLTERYASKQFQTAFRRAGISGNLHRLRHTYALTAHEALTRLQHAGKPINVLMTLRDLLGHTSVATTEIYLSRLEIEPEKIDEALNYLYGEVIDDEPAFDGAGSQ